MKNLIKISLLMIIISSLFTTTNVSAEVVVVVHPSNAAAITNDDIKRIFLGKSKNFPGGTTALPVNLKSSQASRADFEKKALGKSSNQMKAYWSKLVFSGKANPPQEVDSDQEVIKLVKENPAVIGYVDAANVTADVKVVSKF